MKKLRTNCCTLAILLPMTLSVTSYAGLHEDAIQEAQQLIEQAKQLHGQGRYQEAIPIAERGLKIRERERVRP